MNARDLPPPRNTKKSVRPERLDKLSTGSVEGPNASHAVRPEPVEGPAHTLAEASTSSARTEVGSARREKTSARAEKSAAGAFVKL